MIEILILIIIISIIAIIVIWFFFSSSSAKPVSRIKKGNKNRPVPPPTPPSSSSSSSSSPTPTSSTAPRTATINMDQQLKSFKMPRIQSTKIKLISLSSKNVSLQEFPKPIMIKSMSSNLKSKLEISSNKLNENQERLSGRNQKRGTKFTEKIFTTLQSLWLPMITLRATSWRSLSSLRIFRSKSGPIRDLSLSLYDPSKPIPEQQLQANLDWKKLNNQSESFQLLDWILSCFDRVGNKLCPKNVSIN
ncbi:hypothetical protein SSS_08147 [Sarcoptes scabiei]|uniref:Uncharacterized protein n=2 Tax=Sarcoptes scabiei TaxID=52283 RepID=A0A834R430_SARSC|nr:hypothetical protein SSS_08147 [Sarcoptes scabiei]